MVFFRWPVTGSTGMRDPAKPLPSQPEEPDRAHDIDARVPFLPVVNWLVLQHLQRHFDPIPLIRLKTEKETHGTTIKATKAPAMR